MKRLVLHTLICVHHLSCVKGWAKTSHEAAGLAHVNLRASFVVCEGVGQDCVPGKLSYGQSYAYRTYSP